MIAGPLLPAVLAILTLPAVAFLHGILSFSGATPAPWHDGNALPHYTVSHPPLAKINRRRYPAKQKRMILIEV
jgi:hypothetical protein